MSLFFVGAYTADMGGTADGIAALGSLPDGSLELLGTAAAADSPSFLAAHGDLVYAASEATGRIEAYRRAGGFALKRVATAESGGSAPCHVARYGDTVVAACYVDGRLGVLDAQPLALAQTVEGTAGTRSTGPHPAQDASHAHATFALDDTTILSADLGTDELHSHALAGGRLTRTGSLRLPAGTGPRDFLRHPSGLVLVLGELGLTLTALDDRLEVVATVDLAGGEPGDHAAALSTSADGRFVYAGLRGSNRISIIEVDGGVLRPAGWIDAEGDWPRHHLVDGDVMHVAHERSNTVATFRIGENGIPGLISAPIRVSSPIFLLKA
ncbi:lactonase family protein [Conyzicola sp.]|uniref:lactonase family protein n=1 Tax=Conyzicola sp. TaxID=1969404 RepID=UPI0039890DB0